MDYKAESTLEAAEEEAQKMMNRLDALSLKKHDMSIKEAQEILDDFARVLIFLSESSCYPSPYKPNSLLPRNKEKIEIAFAIGMKYAEDNLRKHALYLNYCELMDGFRPDKEAEKYNLKLLKTLINK